MFFQILCLLFCLFPVCAKECTITKVDGATFYQYGESEINNSTHIIVFAGGTRAGKSSTHIAMQKNDKLQRLYKKISKCYKPNQKISFVFMDEVPKSVIDIKGPKYIRTMVSNLQNNNMDMFVEFERDILKLQLKRLQNIPKKGVVIVFCDRHILDIYGYMKMFNLKTEAQLMFKRFLTRDKNLLKIFMFVDFIPHSAAEDDSWRIADEKSAKQDSQKAINSIGNAYKRYYSDIIENVHVNLELPKSVSIDQRVNKIIEGVSASIISGAKQS